MTIQQAIEKAIEGGYKGNKEFLLKLPEYAKSQIWLDPLFWQSLGKAMGWNGDGPFESTFEILVNDKPKWNHEWHRFINTLSEGKSADDFFKEL